MSIVIFMSGCAWHATLMQDDVQGQILSEKSINSLKVGMSQGEVMQIMGSPLLYNINDNRWEYIDYKKVKGKVLRNKKLVLTFTNESLDNIEYIDQLKK